MAVTLHHFVPQFYLRRFAGQDGLLQVYDKDEDRVFSANPRNLAGERGFYTLPGVFPDSTVMEQQFSALEKEAAAITEDWLMRIQPGFSLPIPETNREIMSLYITTQMLRTSETRALLAQSMMRTRDEPIDKEALRDIHAMDLLWNEKIIGDTSNWVKKCGWVFRLNTGPDSLYTSDDPVKIRSRTQHLNWAQTSVEGAYLLIPLTPNILMYCFDSIGWSTLMEIDTCVISKPLEPHLIRDSNIHQVGHAHRFVFSNQDNFLLAREFCTENPGAVGQDRRRLQH